MLEINKHTLWVIYFVSVDFSTKISLAASPNNVYVNMRATTAASNNDENGNGSFILGDPHNYIRKYD